MTDLSRPQDKFFRELFSRSEVGKDFLRNYLPGEIVRLLDVNTMIGHSSVLDLTHNVSVSYASG